MKRKIITALFGILIFAFPGQASAAGLIIIDDPQESFVPGEPPHWPGPHRPPRHWFPRPIHRFTPLEIRMVKATTSIKDQVAQTRIEQEFYNPNPNPLEGTFILPLPKGAHLDRFRMEVNGKMTDAELLSADKARNIYEEIVRKAKDPALLEYIGRDLLKVRIFPIEPHSSKKIELSYAQVLKSDSGLVEYSLPLNTAKYCATPIQNFSLKLELASSTPLKTIYSPTHSIEVKRSGDNSATIGLEESQLMSEKDLQLFYSAEKSELGLNFLTYRDGQEEGYFMLLASPGFDTAKSKVIPKDVLFVIDTSGSMAGKKIDQAKKALLFCVNNLNERDRFEIVRFSTETENLFGELRDVTAKSREKAEEFVQNLKAIGGTAIHDALEKALEIKGQASRPRLVVFLTDGLPTVGDTSESGILQTVKSNREGITRVFTFGVGTDVNTHLLDKIAEETSAVSQYVLPDEDTEVKLSSFFSKVSDPVLADVSIDFGRIRASKVHPGKMPDVFKGQQLIVLGRYDGEGKTTVTVKGKVADEIREFTYPVAFSEDDTEHQFIPRLWATRRVGYLLDEIRLHGENAELKDEVTELAKKYSIATPYTSYLITEDRPAVARNMTPSLGGAPLVGGAFRREARVPQLQEGERLVRSYSAGVSGDAAVANSRYANTLKSAVTEDQLQTAPEEVQRLSVTGRLQATPVPGEVPQQKRQFIGARTFQQQGDGLWIEATLENVESKDLIRIEFDSEEFWDLAAKNPEIRDVLALGTDIRFRLGNKVYQIYRKNI